MFSKVLKHIKRFVDVDLRGRMLEYIKATKQCNDFAEDILYHQDEIEIISVTFEVNKEIKITYKNDNQVPKIRSITVPVWILHATEYEFNRWREVPEGCVPSLTKIRKWAEFYGMTLQKQERTGDV
jgi:myo-inositol-hexaphosphate 3-phosphohydrolase